MIGQGQNECLREVTAEAAKHVEWSDFAAYCRDRELGLRTKAFDHLNRFIATAKDWSFDRRKEFVNWMCECLARHRDSDGYGLAPKPITLQLIEPTLQEWMAAEPHNSTPCRWAGMFFSGVAYGVLRVGLANSTDMAISHLREALFRDSGDEVARVRLIELIVGNVQFDCHHLPYYYIGNPQHDLADLAEARQLLVDVANRPVKDRLATEIDHGTGLVGDWIAFNSEGEPDFNVWCAKRGRQYSWVRAYYYGL